MRIKDLLSESTINVLSKAQNKSEVIDEAVNLLFKNDILTDKDAFAKAVWDREKQSTTGLGDGLAIPHGRGKFVKKPALAALVIKNGVDYESLDGQDVKLVFLIAAPETKGEENLHLEVLAKLSKMLLDKEFINKLVNAKSAKELLNLIEAKEDEINAREVAQVNSDKVFLVGITSCPTGIAHTYMAQEALENAAKKLNVDIKIETQGSGGAKNILADSEIEKAAGVIIAADTNVELDRFVGKKLLQASVTQGIKEPENLINKVLNENVEIYSPKGVEKKTTQATKPTFIQTVYKHVMSGVSHMLPFVIGGGILIALSFLIDSFYGTEAVGENFGSYSVVAKFFKDSGQFAFGFMLAVLAGYIAYSIAGRPGLAVGMAAGAIAASSSFMVSQTGSNAGFLGALIGGFLAGYVVVLLGKAFTWLPKSMDGIKPMLIYPLLGLLIVALIMFFVVNTPLAYLNKYINLGLEYIVGKNASVSIGFKIGVGALLAGMMAVDMGGPINKVAYTIGVASLDPAGINQPWIMAAVMVGGMVPPLLIALAADLFPQKFTKKERNDSKINYLMGISFITEGAIPYAAADPLRVILSSIIASAIAGALSAGLGASIPAPHGGVFVFIVAQKWYWYIFSLVVGTVIGAFVLGALKRNVENPELGKWKGIPIGNGISFKINARKAKR